MRHHKQVVVGSIALLLAGVVGCGSEQSLPKLRRAEPASVSDATDDDGDDKDDGMLQARPTPPSALPEAKPLVEVSLVDLTPVSMTNGHGPVEKNMSVGELAANDGKALMIGGIPYEKGFGVHSASELVFSLAGQYTTFMVDVGMDDEVADQGLVTFRILADDMVLFDSGAMNGATPMKKVEVSVAGKQQLKLVVTDAEDGPAYDHADWANPRLLKP
jgi:hypothetical protein